MLYKINGHLHKPLAHKFFDPIKFSITIHSNVHELNTSTISLHIISLCLKLFLATITLNDCLFESTIMCVTSGWEQWSKGRIALHFPIRGLKTIKHYLFFDFKLMYTSPPFECKFNILKSFEYKSCTFDRYVIGGNRLYLCKDESHSVQCKAPFAMKKWGVINIVFLELSSPCNPWNSYILQVLSYTWRCTSI